MGFAVLDAFLEAWGVLQQAFTHYVGCEQELARAAAAAAAGLPPPEDLVIPSFNEDARPLRLVHVLNLGLGGADTDVIARMLRNRFVDPVATFLALPALEAVRAEDAPTNRFAANAEPGAPELDLAALPPPLSAAPLLLTGGRVLAPASGARGGGGGFDAAVGGALDPALERFIAAHGVRGEEEAAAAGGDAAGPGAPPQWEFDLPAITAFLLSRYIAGRVRLGAGAWGGVRGGCVQLS